MRPDDHAQALFDAVPSRAGDLVAADFPEEPGIYMFTEEDEVMYIGVAAQGIRERVFKHHLVGGRDGFLPIKKTGQTAGITRQIGGCNLIYHLTWEKVGKPLDMKRTDHQTAWHNAVARLRSMDLRWVVLLEVGAERAAKRLRKPRYGK